jgi:hypothetical protein
MYDSVIKFCRQFRQLDVIRNTIEPEGEVYKNVLDFFEPGIKV